jgi:uncharacterized Zn finger protein
VTLFTLRGLERRARADLIASGRRLVQEVTDLDEDEHSVWATVHDVRPYLAMIHHEPPLSGECDCQNGREPGFCEHSVAVALSYLSETQVL